MAAKNDPLRCRRSSRERRRVLRRNPESGVSPQFCQQKDLRPCTYATVADPA
ncbi:expressed unknown protein [Ectocarpus siliculosus]|uniref:Uncharacterized protein n=1 Tax=Ectocarpus siliculosus TaxID=2880 RepID=D8LQZ8_ECTSI|nr:expressed unknown protein [Ectocarpus siliculosus]|eukprot:CBN77671.1 expressed unknown protein [Ectocarpus siliculosus]